MCLKKHSKYRCSAYFLHRVIVNIIHSVKGYHSKTIRFLNVAFDSSGDSLLAGDHQGNIYVFDLNGNR